MRADALQRLCAGASQWSWALEHGAVLKLSSSYNIVHEARTFTTTLQCPLSTRTFTTTLQCPLSTRTFTTTLQCPLSTQTFTTMLQCPLSTRTFTTTLQCPMSTWTFITMHSVHLAVLQPLLSRTVSMEHYSNLHHHIRSVRKYAQYLVRRPNNNIQYTPAIICHDTDCAEDIWIELLHHRTRLLPAELDEGGASSRS